MRALKTSAKPIWKGCFPLLVASAFFLVSGSCLHAQERPPVHRVPPEYPPVARKLRIGGIVQVIATVDATGNVIRTESTSPMKLLVPAACEAVKRWKFAPGDGAATVVVQVNFDVTS